MYMGRRIRRIRFSDIYPDMTPEWVVIDLVKEINLKCSVVNLNETRIVYWWGYGLEF